MKDKRGTPSRE